MREFNGKIDLTFESSGDSFILTRSKTHYNIYGICDSEEGDTYRGLGMSLDYSTLKKIVSEFNFWRSDVAVNRENDALTIFWEFGDYTYSFTVNLYRSDPTENDLMGRHYLVTMTSKPNEIGNDESDPDNITKLSHYDYISIGMNHEELTNLCLEFDKADFKNWIL